MTDDSREDTIRDLLDANDRDDLVTMRREMQELADETNDERDEDLLRYRLDLIEDAIERAD